MTTVDHEDRHVLGVAKRGRVRCAVMFCDAHPTEAQRDRAIQEVEARARRFEPDWRLQPPP